MKIVYILLILPIFFLVSCAASETNDGHGSFAEPKEADFDIDRTVQVIQDALTAESRVNVIKGWVEYLLPELNIRGAINAEQIENTENSDVVVKIETEDNKFFLLTMRENYTMRVVLDLETGEKIFNRTN